MTTNHSKPVSRSGRFQGEVAEEVQQFTESISFDRRLWRQDIEGSKAHATMLAKVGLLSPEEHSAILQTLDQIAREIEQGTFPWRPELEDVHMNIEAELTQRVPAGAKLHTARSRNDQVALDMRLWTREEIQRLIQEIRRLQQNLVRLGKRYAEVIIPGYTHLQRAQPVPFAFHLLAYVEMFQRDIGRFQDAQERLNECPLGSGALAGSTLPIDREEVARQLGFVDAEGRPRITRNSMDAVSDRDFVVEFCAAAALLAIHLSRLAEDLILWSTAEFGFLRISDAYTTGSSLMPQKRNPDVAELIRGKTGRVLGNLQALLVLLKGLPMTYNRDLQEDKERLFDTADTVRSCVRLMAGMLTQIEVNTEACRQAASDPSLLATDVVDYLVRKGVPFREAHHLVGRAVRLAEKQGCTLRELSLEQWQSIHPKIEQDIQEIFDLDQALRRRTAPGTPSLSYTLAELQRWETFLSQQLSSTSSSEKEGEKHPFS